MVPEQAKRIGRATFGPLLHIFLFQLGRVSQAEHSYADFRLWMMMMMMMEMMEIGSVSVKIKLSLPTMVPTFLIMVLDFTIMV